MRQPVQRTINCLNPPEGVKDLKFLVGNLFSGIMVKKCPKHGTWEAEVWCDHTGRIVRMTPDKCPQCEEERRAEERAQWEAEAPAREAARLKEEAEQNEREEREAAARRQAELERRLNASAVPFEYREKSFNNFEVDNETCGEALRQARLYAENFKLVKDTGTGLFLYGTTGTGKTHLACAVLRRLAEQGIDGAYAMTWQIVRAVKSADFKKDPLKPFIDVSILVLDEVGVQSGSRFEETVLYPLIDSRVGMRRPTIFISNVQPDAKDPEFKGDTVRKLIGERLWDRIQHRSIFLKLKGESHRKRFKSVDELVKSATDNPPPRVPGRWDLTLADL